MVAAVAVLLAACGADPGGGEDADRWRTDYVSASRAMSLWNLVAVSADEGWAVAMEHNAESTVYTLLHRDGADWQNAPMPPALRWEGGAEISELAASGPDNVWLFGRLAADEIARDPQQGAMRWDGQRWIRMAADFTVREAVAVAPDDVWALDASTPEPVAHHWDGARWDATALPADHLDSLAASGQDDVWASGQAGGQPAIAHFDGQRWQPMEVPEFPLAEGETARISDIVSVSRDEAWAFGAVTATATTAGPDQSYTAFALRWNGEAWQKQPDAFDNSEKQTPPNSALLATGDGAGGFVLASAFGTEQHRTREGARRVIRDPEPVAGRTDEITEVDRRQHVELHDLQLVPGTREIWGVGAVGVSPLPPGEQYTRGVVVSYSADR